MNLKMNKTEIVTIIEQLIQLGEDRDELDYWLQIYDYLPEEKQAELYENLSHELEALNRV